MLRTLVAAVVVGAAAGSAAAQTPGYSFHQIGTTGNLHTSESRDHWKKVYAKLQKAKAVSDKVSDTVREPLGLPSAPSGAALAKVATVVQVLRKSEAEESTWLPGSDLMKRVKLKTDGGW